MQRQKAILIGVALLVASCISCTSWKAEYIEHGKDGVETTRLIIQEHTAFGKSQVAGKARTKFNKTTGNLESLDLGQDSKIDATGDTALIRGLVTVGKILAGVPIGTGAVPVMAAPGVSIPPVSPWPNAPSSGRALVIDGTTTRVIDFSKVKIVPIP